jgi:1-acyl-sn-glycerol-3-phosphate acyltransferase
MRATYKFLLLILFLLVVLLPAAIVTILGMEKTRQRVVQWVFRKLCDIFGLNISTKGTLPAHRPLLLVSNHCSYLDILVLGSAGPLSFTPKSDIKTWPLINLCCMVSGCVFVERKPARLPTTRKAIHKALQKGRVICLFPEGTTNNGTDLKPFKSGFFSLAESEVGLMVQPVSLRYTHRDDHPLDEPGRSEIAWYGNDTTLLPHLMRVLSSRRIQAEIVFHPPLTMTDYPTRKELAKACEVKVGEGLSYAPALPESSS